MIKKRTKMTEILDKERIREIFSLFLQRMAKFCKVLINEKSECNRKKSVEKDFETAYGKFNLKHFSN